MGFNLLKSREEEINFPLIELADGSYAHEHFMAWGEQPEVSRRTVLARALGAAGLAATAWFLPPEVRGRETPSALAQVCNYPCAVQGRGTWCNDRCGFCSGGYQTPVCMTLNYHCVCNSPPFYCPHSCFDNCWMYYYCYYTQSYDQHYCLWGGLCGPCNGGYMGNPC